MPSGSSPHTYYFIIFHLDCHHNGLPTRQALTVILSPPIQSSTCNQKDFLNYKSSHKPENPSLGKTLQWLWRMLRNCKVAVKSQIQLLMYVIWAHIVGKKKHWILKLWLSRVQTYCHLSRWPHSLRYWFTSCMDPGPQGSSFSQGEQSLSCSGPAHLSNLISCF